MPRDDIHPSMRRLLEAAMQATAGTRHPIRDYTDLGVRMEESSGVITNWKARGVSAAGALKAELLFGCSPNWVLSGQQPFGRGGATGNPWPFEAYITRARLESLTPDQRAAWEWEAHKAMAELEQAGALRNPETPSRKRRVAGA